jgi:hypothetical protein
VLQSVTELSILQGLNQQELRHKWDWLGTGGKPGRLPIGHERRAQQEGCAASKATSPEIYLLAAQPPN